MLHKVDFSTGIGSLENGRTGYEYIGSGLNEARTGFAIDTTINFDKGF